MRYITGQREDDVRSAAREANIPHAAYKYVRMGEENLRGLRGAVLEYVGKRPDQRYMELAAAMDIQVVKFDQIEGGDEGVLGSGPDRVMVGDIEVVRMMNQQTWKQEFRARRGTLWIMIDPAMVKEANGDVQVLCLMLVPVFGRLEKEQTQTAGSKIEGTMGSMVRDRAAKAERDWRAKYEATPEAQAWIPDARDTADAFKYMAEANKQADAAKTAQAMRHNDMAAAQAFLDMARAAGLDVPEFSDSTKAKLEDLAKEEEKRALPAPEDPIDENEANIQESHKRVNEAEKQGQITAEQATAMREKIEAMRTNLILAGDEAEAATFAAFMEFNNWVFLDSYRRLMNYGGSVVYVVGGGRDREDFAEIEALFEQKNIQQVDMEG